MDKKLKVYVVGDSIWYARFLDNYELVENIEEADVVIFTGGEDVTPSVYGCEKHYTTGCNIDRDQEEIEEFNKIRPDQLVVGICRGSQFLCAINGGILVQNCNNHGIYGTHDITNGTEHYQITSTHHQMQFPYFLPKEDYTLLFWAEGLSTKYEGDKVDSSLIEQNGEAEIVLYHKQNLPKCIAIQGHPEGMRHNEPVVEMLNKLINNYINE